VALGTLLHPNWIDCWYNGSTSAFFSRRHTLIFRCQHWPGSIVHDSTTCARRMRRHIPINQPYRSYRLSIQFTSGSEW
jgi:hypothetical protein